MRSRAAERRQKCGADAIGSRRSTNLSPPPGACGLFAVPTLGLTPQAKNMPLLRSSSSGVNLFQDETIGWILHLASCIWTDGPAHQITVQSKKKVNIAPSTCPTDPADVASGLGSGPKSTRMASF